MSEAVPDEAKHLRDLVDIKRRNLRIIEQQIAEFGAYAPTHLLTQRAELRQELGIAESVASSPYRQSLGDELGEAGRFIAYLEELRRTNQSIGLLGARLDALTERLDTFMKYSHGRWVTLRNVVMVLCVIFGICSLLIAFYLGRLT